MACLYLALEFFNQNSFMCYNKIVLIKNDVLN